MHADVEDMTSGALSGCEDYYTECILILRGSLPQSATNLYSLLAKSDRTDTVPTEGFQIGVLVFIHNLLCFRDYKMTQFAYVMHMCVYTTGVWRHIYRRRFIFIEV